MMMIILCTEGRIFSLFSSSRGQLGGQSSSDESGCPSLVSVVMMMMMMTTVRHVSYK